ELSLIPTRPVPAVRAGGTEARAGNRMVKAPGQNASINTAAADGTCSEKDARSFGDPTNTRIGFPCARPLTADNRSRAVRSHGFTPRPENVSVGRATARPT